MLEQRRPCRWVGAEGLRAAARVGAPGQGGSTEVMGALGAFLAHSPAKTPGDLSGVEAAGAAASASNRWRGTWAWLYGAALACWETGAGGCLSVGVFGVATCGLHIPALQNHRAAPAWSRRRNSGSWCCSSSARGNTANPTLYD